MVLEVPELCSEVKFGDSKHFPLGLSTAPLVCTRLLAPLSTPLHADNILFHRYLDDLFIRAPAQSLCWS